MATQTIYGSLKTIRDCYVDASQPNVAIWNEELLFNNTQTLIPLIAFDSSQVAQIPPYANLIFTMSYKEWYDIRGVYGLNSSWGTNVTYNTRPSMTLLSTLSITGHSQLVDIPIGNPQSIKYGLSIQGNKEDSQDNRARSSRDGRYIPSLSWSYTLDDSTLTFTTSGTSIDDTITVNWTLANQLSGTLKAYQNGSMVATKSVTTQNAIVFEAGAFKTTADITFVLEAGIKGTLYTSRKVLTGLTKIVPSISSLEPDKVNQNVDNDITVSWVAINQHSYKLEIDGTTYTGTTQNTLRIPGGTLSQGTKTIKLTIFYTSSWGEIRSVTKSVTFIGYGKPPLPTLNIKSLYSDATPSIRWVSSGQVAYRIIITSGISTIIDTQEVISPNLYYTLSKALSNNTDYVVKLKVKNQYNLWSDEVAGNFRTGFNVPITPSITVTADDSGAIIVNVSANVTSDTTYKNTEIWRREELGEWVRIAYNLNANVAYRDFYVASDKVYEYKARNISQSGGVSESDIVSTSTKVQGYTFYDVENKNNYVSFINDVTVNPKFNVHESSNIFAGNERPTTEQGPEGYYDCAISFKTTDRTLEAKLIKLKRTAKVLLFKDRRGHKYFGNIVGSIAFSEDSIGIITIELQFIETNFLEQDVYAGENSGIKLLKWDGTWKFDGTHSYS